MAHSLSAKKRVRQNAKKRIINRARKSQLKSETRKFEEALKAGDVDAAKEQYRLLVKKLDKVAATSTLHKGTAARRKSRLAKRLNAMASAKA
ncbi:30S ribosomal protein S20 [Limihaloglobus sulfuriphilus]|uniref:Small ribosomal subunit protein bS20 n=1 Tax=Limihaloglobus sulfuriphilus TaxID=1851148 RepID=A0A1Q2MEB7_9BACT|nr:30S ribosomal protein S20 [Limihaloglobus sulfuriphilus]AQQ70888.1 30S ribosomal protein S20 [Limihaloglobus sulfuriphilus]